MESRRVNIDIKLFAEWLVLYFNQRGTPITPLKLQKILYYCQAWFLAVLDNPIFNDEAEAWTMGPVYREIYDKYKTDYLRFEKIKSDIADIDNEFERMNKTLDFNEDQKDLLDEILVKYGSFTDDQLILRTHNEDPWRKTREKCPPFAPCSEQIPHSLMKEYYYSLIKDGQSN